MKKKLYLLEHVGALKEHKLRHLQYLRHRHMETFPGNFWKPFPWPLIQDTRPEILK